MILETSVQYRTLIYEVWRKASVVRKAIRQPPGDIFSLEGVKCMKENWREERLLLCRYVLLGDELEGTRGMGAP